MLARSEKYTFFNQVGIGMTAVESFSSVQILQAVILILSECIKSDRTFERVRHIHTKINKFKA